MSKHTIAETELNPASKQEDYQQHLLKRINKIAVALMSEFEDKNRAMDALILDDGSLMQLLYSILMEKKVRIADYEVRKPGRHSDNLAEFYKSLQALGGVLKVNEVAEILGVTCQAVIVRIRKNQLLAFKQNGKFILPAFQFINSGLIPGFKEIMQAFEEDTHPMLRLGILKTPIHLDNDVIKTPIQIMLDGAEPNELKLAMRAARLLANHVAN
ncbi:DNA-binding protein [Klebsiella oxytoca]|uniref:DNA-binding protein n=1 Tax=Klebsiella oxytoca TaxID=571 RepID=UPI003570F6B9